MVINQQISRYRKKPSAFGTLPRVIATPSVQRPDERRLRQILCSRLIPDPIHDEAVHRKNMRVVDARKLGTTCLL